MLRTIANVLWLVLYGFWMAVGYVLAGAVALLLVVTIPFGVAAFRLAGYALWPFGRTVVWKPSAGAASTVGNVLWLLLFGWWLALGHLVGGIAFCLTLIGIPFGIASFKMIPLALLPLGRDVVPSSGVRPEQRPGSRSVPSAN